MLKLYNTLTKRIEEFIPRSPDSISVYCCGPTVYDYATIGNFRTYAMSDFLVRTIQSIYQDTPVKYAMNITDVGHLVSDSDTGEDKLEKGARREGKTAWEIAEMYTTAFLSDYKNLNLVEPEFRPRATKYISEQIAMVETLLAKKFAYRIDDGIYFDTSKFAGYGVLTGQRTEDLMAGARVEPNPQKRNPTDFALWKFSPKDAQRDMEWESPWGKGFPGWHIECSAMSMSTLQTKQIDVHTGGADLIPIHHTNEIAQSEAATGVSPFVRYWVHGQFITVDGEKMSKSKGNFYTLKDITDKGFDPLALRYFYMTAHYRSYLNFTWEGLTGAQNALIALRTEYARMRADHELVNDRSTGAESPYIRRFFDAIEDDLNMPKALATVWEMVKSDIPERDKFGALQHMDYILGFDLQEWASKHSDFVVPEEITILVRERESARLHQDYRKSDELRNTIASKGYILEDTPNGVLVKKNASHIKKSAPANRDA